MKMLPSKDVVLPRKVESEAGEQNQGGKSSSGSEYNDIGMFGQP